MNKSLIKSKISNIEIEQLKQNETDFYNYVNSIPDNHIIYLLEKLWKLNNDWLINPLLFLINHNNEKVRISSLKNLAKIQNPALVQTYTKIIRTDKSSSVRREAVSAIWRQRSEANIHLLIELLKDNDPKVVMQSIRWLLKFTHIKDVKDNLIKLQSHPNEQIKEVIHNQFLAERKQIDDNPLSKNLENIVIHWDVLENIRKIPNWSIHLTFTSPPYYNARDYSIYQSYEEYLNFLEEVFKEIHRITKEWRFFVLNTSPIIIPRISRAHSSKRYPIPYDLHPLLVKMGWEFIDDIIWVKPEASVKNRNAWFLQHRKPLGYKPNAITESIMVYRKKTDKLIDRNIKQYNEDIINESKINWKYETTNVRYIDPKFDKTHSAVFPIDLCNKIIQYYSYKSDLVFDPFAWSGTLGKAAIELWRKFLLTEKEQKYIERIKEILWWKNSFFIDNIKFLDTNTFNSIL